MKFDKNYLQCLAERLLFEIDENEIPVLQAEFEMLEHQLAILDLIDTKDISPMTFPFFQEATYLRDDKPANLLTAKESLANAPETAQDYIQIRRVIK